MSVTRINEFRARGGQGGALRRRLELFLPIIRSSQGCRSCELLEGLDDPDQIAIVEVWESVEAHQAAAQNIPPETIQETVALLAEPAKGVYYRS
jgi:quinol monooxygenase YgiN